MTTRSVDFYFDFGSPASYLAATQLPQDGQLKIYARSPRTVEDGAPVLKGRVLKLSPRLPPPPVR